MNVINPVMRNTLKFFGGLILLLALFSLNPLMFIVGLVIFASAEAWR